LNEHAPLYQHSKRPEWGYCAVMEVLEDRTTFKFDDGSSRAISRNHIQMMVQVEPAEPEATEIRKRLAKYVIRSANADGKPKKKSAAKKKPAVVTTASSAPAAK